MNHIRNRFFFAFFKKDIRGGTLLQSPNFFLTCLSYKPWQTKIHVAFNAFSSNFSDGLTENEYRKANNRF